MFGLNFPGCRVLDRQTAAYFRARYAGDSLLPKIACRPVYDRYLNHWVEPYQLAHATRLRDGYESETLSPEDRIAHWFTSVVTDLLAAPPDAAPDILDRALREHLGRRTGGSEADLLRRFVATVTDLLAGDYDFGHYLRRRQHPETEGYVRTVREELLRRHTAAAVARVPFLAHIIDMAPTGAAPDAPAPNRRSAAATGTRPGPTTGFIPEFGPEILDRPARGADRVPTEHVPAEPVWAMGFHHRPDGQSWQPSPNSQRQPETGTPTDSSAARPEGPTATAGAVPKFPGRPSDHAIELFERIVEAKHAGDPAEAQLRAEANQLIPDQATESDPSGSGDRAAQPTADPSRFTIEHATVDDVPQLVHCLLEGVRAAYRDLEVVPGKPGVDALIRDMAGRKPQEFEQVIREARDIVLVHRTSDGRIAGFAQSRPDADGNILFLGWHLLEEFHGTGLSRALLRRILSESGDGVFYGYTTIGAKAFEVFKKLGFKPEGDPLPTPGPMAEAGLIGLQQHIVLDQAGRQRLLSRLAEDRPSANRPARAQGPSPAAALSQEEALDLPRKKDRRRAPDPNAYHHRPGDGMPWDPVGARPELATPAPERRGESGRTDPADAPISPGTPPEAGGTRNTAEKDAARTPRATGERATDPVRTELDGYVARGNIEGAVALLRKRFAHSVFPWVQQSVRSSEVARELFDTACRRAVENIGRIGEVAVEDWLVRHARELITQRRRENLSATTGPADAAATLPPVSAAELIAALQRSRIVQQLPPIVRYALDREPEALEAVLEELAPGPRRLLELRFGLAMPVERTARALSRSEGAVRTAQRAAFLRLARLLEERPGNQPFEVVLEALEHDREAFTRCLDQLGTEQRAAIEGRLLQQLPTRELVKAHGPNHYATYYRAVQRLSALLRGDAQARPGDVDRELVQRTPVHTLEPAIAQLTNAAYREALTLRFVHGLGPARAAAAARTGLRAFEMRELRAIRAVAAQLRAGSPTRHLPDFHPIPDPDSDLFGDLGSTVQRNWLRTRRRVATLPLVDADGGGHGRRGKDDEEQPPEPRKPSLWRLFRNRPDIALRVSGHMGSSVGTLLTDSMMPYFLISTAGPETASWVRMVGTLPYLGGPILAGILAEHKPAKPIMITGEALALAAAAEQLIVIGTGASPTYLPLAAMAMSTGAILYGQTSAKVLREMFGVENQEELSRYISLQTGLPRLINGLGPAVATTAPLIAPVANGISSAWNLATMRRMPKTATTPLPSGKDLARRVLKSAGTGFRTIHERPLLQRVSANHGINNFILAMELMYYSMEILDSPIPEWQKYTILSSMPLAGVLGGRTPMKLREKLDIDTILTGKIVGLAGVGLAEAMTDDVLALAPFWLAAWAMLGLGHISQEKYRLQHTPGEAYARANSVHGMIGNLATPLGGLAVGAGLLNLGTGPAQWISAGAVTALASGLIVRNVIERRRSDQPVPTPDPEIIRNCAIQVARAHRALGYDSGSEPDDTDQRWNADNNWRITEKSLGNQLRPFDTGGRSPVHEAAAIIANPDNDITSAAVVVDGHIHYLAAIDGDTGTDILVFDTLIDDEDTVHIRNLHGDENGGNKWTASYNDFDDAFAAFWTSTDGRPEPLGIGRARLLQPTWIGNDGNLEPALRPVRGLRNRRHPTKLLGRPEDAADRTPAPDTTPAERALGDDRAVSLRQFANDPSNKEIAQTLSTSVVRGGQEARAGSTIAPSAADTEGASSYPSPPNQAEALDLPAGESSRRGPTSALGARYEPGVEYHHPPDGGSWESEPLTAAQARELRDRTAGRLPDREDARYQVWVLPDPRPGRAGASVSVRVARTEADGAASPPVAVGAALHTVSGTEGSAADQPVDGIRLPRELYRDDTMLIREHASGKGLSVADFIGPNMTFRADLADELFDRLVPPQAAGSDTTLTSWERRIHHSLRVAEARIAALGVGSELLPIPALTETFRPFNRTEDPGISLHAPAVLADLLANEGGAPVWVGSDFTEAGPPSWAYATFLTRNPWPPEVHAQVHEWCLRRLQDHHDAPGTTTMASFFNHVAIDTRLTLLRRAFQLPQEIVRNTTQRSAALAELGRYLAISSGDTYHVGSFETGGLRLLDQLCALAARGWARPEHRAEVVPRLGEPLPPRLGRPIRELLENNDDPEALLAAIQPLQQTTGTHRLNVLRAYNLPLQWNPPRGRAEDVVASIGMRATVMIGCAEFGDVRDIAFELEADGTVTAYIDPVAAAQFVPEYRAARGGAGRGSFIDMMRHFARTAGADRLALKDDPACHGLYDRECLLDAGFTPMAHDGSWLSEPCRTPVPLDEGGTPALSQRLTRDQVLQLMGRVSVTHPDEYENQCGVWYLPLNPAQDSNSPMVAVRVYLPEAQQLGFDLDELAVSAPDASDMFHAAGVRGPRLLYDSQSGSTAPGYPTRVSMHEYVPGEPVTPEEGWQRTTADAEQELDRLHSMPVPDSYLTQHYWDRVQQDRVRRLERADTDRRLDALTGGVPLFATWLPLPEEASAGAMGFTHGNPIRRKMRRGADGRIGFTDAKSAQYAPIAWDWARYYLINDWADDAEREQVYRYILEKLESQYEAEYPGTVDDFKRYVQLEARKSLAGDAYRLPKKIAAGIVSVDDVVDDFHRNVELVSLGGVRRTAGWKPLTREQVRELLLEWSRRELQSHMPGAPAAVSPPVQEAPNTQAVEGWVRRLFATALPEPGVRAEPEEARTALAAVQRWDGSLRLEPARARLEYPGYGDIHARLYIDAVVMEGTRAYDDVVIRFELDRSGRITAVCEGADTSIVIDSLVLKFVRDAGADRLCLRVTDGTGAARAGFDWDSDHLDEIRPALRAAVERVVADLTYCGAPIPDHVTEAQRLLREGGVPNPRQLLDLGLDPAAVAPHWWGFLDLHTVADAGDAVWTPTGTLPVEPPVNPPPLGPSLVEVIESEGVGVLPAEDVARITLRASLRAADYHGANNWAWSDRDGSGSPVILRRAMDTGSDKDLTRNPRRTGTDGRWFRPLDFDAFDAVDLAATAVEVPKVLHRQGRDRIEQRIGGRTPAPESMDRESMERLLDQMFTAKRALLNIRVPEHLRVRSVTEHLYLYLDKQREKYRNRADWLDTLCAVAPHEAWSPDTDDEMWQPSLNHNDMTLSNIRIDRDGNMTLIDWDNAAITHPLWDYVTILWTMWPAELVDAVEAKIRAEVRDLFGARGEAELDRLLTMACLDSLYGDSKYFVEQIAEDPSKADTLIQRFDSDYRRLCRLRGWEPADSTVVRGLMLSDVNARRRAAGLEPLPRPDRPVGGAATAASSPALPSAAGPGDAALLEIADDLVDRTYGTHRYQLRLTAAKLTGTGADRCLTVAATIVAGDGNRHESGRRRLDEAGDMRFHIRPSTDGRCIVTFDHLVIDQNFTGHGFTKDFIPRLRAAVGTGGRVVMPVHGRVGLHVAARHGLRLDPDPAHLAESRRNTAQVLTAHGCPVVADPMLDRFDRPAEAHPALAELADYFEDLPRHWPTDHRWWGVLDGGPATDTAAEPEQRPATPRVAPRRPEAADPILTESVIDLLATMVKSRSSFTGNYRGVWVVTMPNEEKVVVRVATQTANPDFDPRIGLVVGEQAAERLFRSAGVRVQKLYHDGLHDPHPERYLYYEFIDGTNPSPDEPWQPLAEKLFDALDHAHALHPQDWNDPELVATMPADRVEWERRLVREIERIPLEYDDTAEPQHRFRFHRELRMPGLREIFDIRPQSADDVQLGTLHGDPTLGNILRRRDGEFALIDLEFVQPGPPVWDYVAFASRGPWSNPEVRAAVENWCRRRILRKYGRAAAADFDRYLLLEAWKSVAGDSNRLTKRVAENPAFAEEAARILHRNMSRVLAQVGREPQSVPELRDLLLKWSRQLVNLPDELRSDSTADTAAPYPTEAARLPRLDLRTLLRAGGEDLRAAEDRLREALPTVRCADGPPRLEPARAWFEPIDADAAGDLVSRIVIRTELMAGPYEYGTVHVRFDLDRSGRITAHPEPAPGSDELAREYGGPYLLGVCEDLARRLGADALEVRVSHDEGPRAAANGFGWSTDPAKRAETARAIRASTNNMRGGDDSAAALGDPVPPLPDTPQDAVRQAGPLVLHTEWWAGKDLTDPALPATPIELRPRIRPRCLDPLPDITEAVQTGRMNLEHAAQIAVTTAMLRADGIGHHISYWCVRGPDGEQYKVRQVTAKPGGKDLGANPTHPKLLDRERELHRIPLDDEDYAEELARRAGVLIPETVAQWGDRSIRRMGEGEVPTVDDANWEHLLRGVLAQLRRLQSLELPAELQVRTLAEHEHLYRSMQRIKYEQRHPLLDLMRIPMPNEISVPGDTTWEAGLSHGNVTTRNLWARPDGEVLLDNWNLASVRHKLWDYVTIFWSPWPPGRVDQVRELVEAEIRELYGESGVREFRRLRAIACLDSLYSDSNDFVAKIRRDRRAAATLAHRFYSDYRTLWEYAEDTGTWSSRGARPLSYEQVYDLLMHAADPTHRPAHLPELDFDTRTATARAQQAGGSPVPDLSAVPTFSELFAAPPPEHELLSRLSGLQQRYGDLEFVLNRVEYLRSDGVPTGVRIRGVMTVPGRDRPVEAGDIDLSIGLDDSGRLTARFGRLWVEPWLGPIGAGRHLVPALRDYLRRSGVEAVTFPVRGRRGAAAAIHHGLDWNGANDPELLATHMWALASRIRVGIALAGHPAQLPPELERTLQLLENPAPDANYPTLAEIAAQIERAQRLQQLPSELNMAEFFDGVHWQGRTAP